MYSAQGSKPGKQGAAYSPDKTVLVTDCSQYFFTVFSILSQSQTEDGIRKELLALQEDKHNYETTTKETLRKVLQEKIEVVRKLAEVEVGYILFLTAQCR